jgi:hypothetical protein
MYLLLLAHTPNVGRRDHTMRQHRLRTWTAYGADTLGRTMEREGFYQLLKSQPKGESDLVEQEFTSATFNVDVPVTLLREVEGENNRLQGDVFGYRACFFMLLGLVVIWGFALMVNRTPPPHLNACEALKYYLGALDEESTKLPVETRQLLDTQASACPDEDLGSFDDGNPHQ